MQKSTRKLSSQDSLHSSFSTDTEFSPKKSSDTANFRRSGTLTSPDLSNARIIQSKLVYVINLPESVASEDTIRKVQYFGQYGTIVKCVVNKSAPHTAYQAYITFSSDEEAAVCIKACNKFVLDGNELTLTFGTTKYCNYFLRGNPCPKPECLYLHEFAHQNNVVPREIIPHTKHIQPSNSIFDCLKLQITQPNKNTSFKLPNAKIIRERAFSEQIFAICERKNEGCSRFGFVVDGDETEVPLHFKQLRKFSSPKDEVVEIPLGQYENIMSHFILDPFLSDILQFKLKQETVVVSAKN